MSQIEYRSFSNGWVPSQDDVNGSPESLLRMDNLQLDEFGVVSNIRAPREISQTIFEVVTSIYSKVFNLRNAIDTSYPINAKLRYIFDVTKRKLFRNYGPTSKSISDFELEIFQGSNFNKTDFVSALAHVFIYNGNIHMKDSGGRRSNLLMASPIAPTTVLGTTSQVRVDRGNVSAPSYPEYWDATSVEGDDYVKTNTYVQIKTGEESHRGIVQMGKDVGVNIDTTNFGNGSGKDSPSDIFQFNFRVSDSSNLTKLRVEFLLNQPTTSTITPDITDYYWFEWQAQDRPASVTFASEDSNQYEYTDGPEFRNYIETNFNDTVQYNSTFRIGSGVWTSLMANRRLFNRVGNNVTLNWNNVRGVLLSVTSIEPITILFNNMYFIGGSEVLNGTYQYIQVDVDSNEGHFLSKSLNSLPSTEIVAINRSVTVTPAQVNAEANQCWIYRANKSLGQYYLIKIITGAYGFTPAPFSDIITDIEALRDQPNVSETRLEYYRTQLPPNIIGATWFKDRMIYISTDSLIPSFYLDPCTYDSRFRYQIANSQNETPYFIAKVSENQLIVATSIDFYSVTGNFGVEALDETIIQDVSILPLGVKKPSVGYAHYVDNSSLYYVAEDGIRTLTLTQNNNSISAATSLMWRNRERYGIGPFLNSINASVFQTITKAKGRLFFNTSLNSTGRVFVIHNEGLNYWTLWHDSASDNSVNPMSCYTEEDGTLIYAGEAGKLKEFDSVDSTIEINLRTIRFGLGAPAQRKDLKAAYIYVDTGNESMTASINGVSFPIQSNGFAQLNAPINAMESLDLAKYYNLIITGETARFKFYGLGFEYDLRPVATTRVKIPPTNLGDPRRKRVRTWPFKIDTLGQNVTIVGSYNGVNYTPQVVNSNYPATKEYFFEQDVFSKDFGLTIGGNAPFEFYEVYPYTIVEILPVEKKWDQIGPIEAYKIGELKSFKVRLLPSGSIINWRVFNEDNIILQGEFRTNPGKHEWFEIQLSKAASVIEVCRIEFDSPNGSFHRTAGFFKVRVLGKETEFQYIEVGQ